MKVAVANQNLSDSLSAKGLKRISATRRPHLWCRTVVDAMPVFAPHVMRRLDRVVISGGIGIHVTEFEIVWAKLLRHFCPDLKFDSGILLGSDLLNFKQFLRQPSITSDSPEALRREDAWIERILAAMDTLPTGLDALLRDLYDNRVGPYPFKWFSADQVRWLAFCRWLRKQGIEPPDVDLPKISGRSFSPTDELRRQLKDGAEVPFL